MPRILLGMRLSSSIYQSQQQSQRIDPRQILASEIMSWSDRELEGAIERELAENPALEARDHNGLFGTYGSTVGGTGQTSSLKESGPRTLQLSALQDADGIDDPFDRVAGQVSLSEHLRSQLPDIKAMYPDINLHALLYLIDNIDDRGYLDTDIADVVMSTKCDYEDANEALEALQQMDPPGIGARDLQESLILQTKHLIADGQGSQLALKILQDHWLDFTSNREQRICTRMRISPQLYAKGVEFIRKALVPYPASGFRPDHGRAESAPAVKPDIVFIRTEAGIQVELARDFEKDIQVSGEWVSMHQSNELKDDASKRYVRDHVERAKAFMTGVARRGKTLKAIAILLAEEQHGFLETQNRTFLRPLTRQSLSQALELDESVISRAVADKWAQLPSGDLMPMESFFGNSEAVREALLNLLASEDPNAPYSDEDIAAILTEQGFPLARRTVAKYRSIERILPARLRKRKSA
ncbi:MAG: RNA polymerase sigma-54 factor [Armatimonadota bacterium]